MEELKYSVMDASTYYSLRSAFKHEDQPVYGVCDEDEGYIAFTTDQAHANLISKTLNAFAFLFELDALDTQMKLC